MKHILQHFYQMEKSDKKCRQAHSPEELTDIFIWSKNRAAANHRNWTKINREKIAAINKNWMTKFHHEYPEKYLLNLLHFWHEFN